MNEKIKQSIELIKYYEAEAYKYGGYTVCFSGGKDSQVLLDLFKKSGVKYTAIYNVTTNDPPENVYFIRENYPEVEFVFPKHTFLQLIENKKFLPTMKCRFCCLELKEYYGRGFVAVGVRREESVKRSKYDVISKSKSKSNKYLFYPILEWREDEIWSYIEENNLPVNPLYDEGRRVGCLFCPFASQKQLIYNANKYPKHHKLFMRSIERIINKGYMREYSPVSAEQVWEWWISKRNAKEFFSQLDLFKNS